MEPEQISKLIQALKINNEKRADEYEEAPEEPKEAMDALVKVGRLAVEPLLELLKDTSKYSCLYAIKVLGEIRDPRAVQPIIEAFSIEVFREVFVETGDYDEPNFALQKIGLPALEPVLNYLEEGKKKADVEGIVFSLSVLAHFKDEKAFKALVSMLSHPNWEVVYWAISSLETYGDERAVAYLWKFLEDEDTYENAASAIKRLIGKWKYREELERRDMTYMLHVDECLEEAENLVRGCLEEYVNSIVKYSIKIKRPEITVSRASDLFKIAQGYSGIAGFFEHSLRSFDISKKYYRIAGEYFEQSAKEKLKEIKPIISHEDLKNSAGFAFQRAGESFDKASIYEKAAGYLEKALEFYRAQKAETRYFAEVVTRELAGCK